MIGPKRAAQKRTCSARSARFTVETTQLTMTRAPAATSCSTPRTVSSWARSSAPKIAALRAGSGECSDTMASPSPPATARRANSPSEKERPCVFRCQRIPRSPSRATTGQNPGWMVGSPPVTKAARKPAAARRSARRKSSSVAMKKAPGRPLLEHIGQALLHCSPRRKSAIDASVTGAARGRSFWYSGSVIRRPR